MLRATLAGMRDRKLRLALTSLAVLLGVLSVTTSLVLADTLGRSFDAVFADAYDETDIWVQGRAAETSALESAQLPNLPDALVDEVATVPGVASATGRVRGDGARVVGSDGAVVASFGPPRQGVDWTGEDGIVTLRTGRGPTAADEIAVNAALAEAAGIAVGDRVGVLTREPQQTFTLVGIYGYRGGRDSLGGVLEVAFTEATAQRLMLGEPDVWTAVDVRAEEGVAATRLRDDIAAAVGGEYQVRTGEEQAAAQSGRFREALGFATAILLGFSGVALFFAVFLILNTFSIVVAQRTRELALVRALGAGRGQLIGSVLLEAAVIGAAASALGLAAGVGVGALLASVAAGFITLPVAGVSVTAGTLAGPFAVGTVVTVVAATAPALRASRVAPVTAMQTAPLLDRPLHRRALVGTAVLLVAAAALGYGLFAGGDAGLAAVLAGVVAATVAVTLLAPLVVRPATAALGRVFAWSVPGTLGRRNAGRHPRRTAVTAGALTIGVALVAGVGVVVSSAQVSIGRLAAERVSADLVVAGEQSGPLPPSFDGDVLGEVAAAPEVATATGVYLDRVRIDGQHTHVYAADDLAVLTHVLGLSTVDGDLGTLAPDEVAVGADLAAERGFAVGERTGYPVPGDDEREFRVAGIYESTPLIGEVILPAEATAQFAVPQPTLGLVDLADPAAAEQVQQRLTRLLADSPEVAVTDQRSYVEQQTGQFDLVVTMVRTLLALAILIAVLGIVNTLALSVLERTREFGLLRALGLSRAGVVRMITVESVVTSLFGALLGVAVGAACGAAVATAMADQGITHLAFPWGDLAGYVLLATVVGVAAAVAPGIRAARAPVLGALAYE